MIIKASLHTLRQIEPGEAALREAVADIDDEVVRLNRIVNEVLDFSRPIPFDFAPADIAALCRESAAAAQASPGAAVALDLDPALPTIVTDGERLRIALVNMLVNARHSVNGDQSAGSKGPGLHPADVARPPADVGRVLLDPPAPLVTLKAAAGGGRVTITITDRGVGVAPADLLHVFDPYFTTKRGGTGLGLPIAKNIVEGLGGTIVVSSVVGRGTEIRIELPVESPAGAAGAA